LISIPYLENDEISDTGKISGILASLVSPTYRNPDGKKTKGASFKGFHGELVIGPVRVCLRAHFVKHHDAFF
jgi:hypothetical protein